MGAASVKREDEAAFEEFVASAGRRLLRTAVLLTGDDGHAEDLLQTALARTARRWTKLDGSPEAYTRTVLANLATDRWRRQRVRPRETVYPNDVSQADFSGDVDLRHTLIAALGRLTRRQRAVLVLRYFDDLTEAETAAALGVSLGTVKSTNFHALRKLREVSELRDASDAENAERNYA